MWINNPSTGSKITLVNSLENTPVSRTIGCLVHECPGCKNLWALSAFRPVAGDSVLFRTSPARQNGEVIRVISDARHPDFCWCGVPFPGITAAKVSQSLAVANLHSALRSALALMGEKSSVLDEMQILTTKVTSSMMRKLRGERSERGVAAA